MNPIKMSFKTVKQGGKKMPVNLRAATKGQPGVIVLSYFLTIVSVLKKKTNYTNIGMFEHQEEASVKLPCQMLAWFKNV